MKNILALCLPALAKEMLAYYLHTMGKGRARIFIKNNFNPPLIKTLDIYV